MNNEQQANQEELLKKSNSENKTVTKRVKVS